jgi:type II secretory pathway pseudopilin PulG
MQLKKIFKRNSRGDTLVEVMLSIAIVSLAVTVAYSLASRSLQTGILATERTQANKMAESQVEALKYRQRESFPGVWDANFKGISNFCLNVNSIGQLDGNGNLKADWKPIRNTGSPGTLAIRGAGPGYDPACADTTQKYFVNISTRNNNDGTGTVYLLTVRWGSVQSSTPNQSTIYYKLPDFLLNSSPSTPPVACVPKVYDIDMLLDASGSMRTSISYNGANSTRFLVLKDVVKQFINGGDDVNITPGGNHVGLVSFSDNSSAKVDYPISFNIPGLIAAADGINIRNLTYVLPGLTTVDAQFSAARPASLKVIILITDGAFTEENYSGGVASGPVGPYVGTLKAKGYIIHTIGIGLNNSGPNAATIKAFLASLATPGAVAANVENGDDLSDLVAQIADVLTCDT